MQNIETLRSLLQGKSHTWAISGVAGFMGSHLLETLLLLDQKVQGLDSFSTGHQKALEAVKALVSEKQWKNFTFIEGDACDSDLCHIACKNAQFVLHHASFNSVPLSFTYPLVTNHSNVTGFLTMFLAAQESNVQRFVYASSCAVYGQGEAFAKQAHVAAKQISPFGTSKYANELYAHSLQTASGMHSIGLRLANIYGTRQEIRTSYSTGVIPLWLNALLHNKPVTIFGDGEATRDFCHVDDFVQANIRAALTQNKAALNTTFNVASGKSLSLNQLLPIAKEAVTKATKRAPKSFVRFDPPRNGDILHSALDITKAHNLLDFTPCVSLQEGIQQCIPWYLENESDKDYTVNNSD